MTEMPDAGPVVDDVFPADDDVPAREVARYALALGDDALIAGQRLGELISSAPELEEDIALANIGLDELGQARALLQYAGRADGRTEDDLAYFRDEEAFRSTHLIEQPNDDFARVIAKMLLFSLYQRELYTLLAESADHYLASVAAKAIKEVRYHVEHAVTWTLRLGDGTDESHRRMSEALCACWPYVDELFDNADFAPLIESGVAVDIAARRDAFDSALDDVLDEATLDRPGVAQALARGRYGEHSQHLGYLLAEMQVLARKHPSATW